MNLLQLIAILSLGGVLLIGCRFPIIQNGTQIETARLPISSFDKLIVPETWTIKETSEFGDEVCIKIEKTLDYVGSPPQSVTLADAVSSMGVVQKEEGGNLKLREFGGFTTSSGGTAISVSIAIPKNFPVEIEPFESLLRHQLNPKWTQVNSELQHKDERRVK